MHVLQHTEAIDVVETPLLEGEVKGIGLDDMAILRRSRALERGVHRSRKIRREVLLRKASGDLGMSARTAAYLKPDLIPEDHFRLNALRQPLWEAVPLKV